MIGISLRIRPRKASSRSRRRTSRYRTAGLGTVESLESRALLTPVIASFDLYADTGTPGDHVTSDPRVIGTVTSGNPADVELEFDYDGDGVAEEWGTLDSNGAFVQDPEGYIGLGSVTVYVRAGEMDWNMCQTVYGDWVALGFTWQPAPPSVTSLEITNPPTGHPGVTLDGLLSGAVAYAGGDLGFVWVELDYTDDGVSDESVEVDSDGTFSWDMNSSAGFGDFLVRARARDTHLGAAGDWVSLGVSHIAAPVIRSFSVEPTDNWHEFRLDGIVEYYDPTLLTIQLSGVVSGGMSADAYGHFWQLHDIDEEGFVYVVVTDQFGRQGTWQEWVLVS